MRRDCGAVEERQAADGAPWRRPQHGSSNEAPRRHTPSTHLLQAALDAEVAAAARQTLLAQCHALLSLDDPACLPHDPLFNMLQASALTNLRSSCSHEAPDIAAALVTAGARAAALAAPTANCIVAESALPGGQGHGTDACRKRSAVVDATPAAAAALLAGEQRRRARLQLVTQDEFHAAPATLAPAPHTATPRHLPGAVAGSKRQRLLLLSAAAACAAAAEEAGEAVATPGSSSRAAAPQRRAGLCVVARDLSFTPAAPAGLLEQLKGTPPLPAAATVCNGSWQPASQQCAAAGSHKPACHLVVKPFNLLRSPGTRSAIRCVNRTIQASAAAPTPFDCWCLASAAGADKGQPLRRAFQAVRLS